MAIENSEIDTTDSKRSYHRKFKVSFSISLALEVPDQNLQMQKFELSIASGIDSPMKCPNNYTRIRRNRFFRLITLNKSIKIGEVLNIV